MPFLGGSLELGSKVSGRLEASNPFAQKQSTNQSSITENLGVSFPPDEILLDTRSTEKHTYVSTLSRLSVHYLPVSWERQEQGPGFDLCQLNSCKSAGMDTRTGEGRFPGETDI